MNTIKEKFSTIIISLFIIGAVIANMWLLLGLSIRLDESQSIWASAKPFYSVLQYTAEDVHVPFYLILLHIWLKIFGNNIFAVRILSLLFFILSLPVIYKSIRDVANKEIALLTVSLFSLSPFVVWYSAEARMYTLFIFISSLNNLAFIRFIQNDGKTHKLLFWITAILGIYTHYFFWFQLLTQAGYIFARSLKAKKNLLPRYLSLLIAAGIFFIPWILFVISQGGFAKTQPLIPKPSTYNIFQTLINFVFGFQSQLIQSLLVSLWPLSVLLMFLIFTRKKILNTFGISYYILSAFLPILIVYAISLIKPIYLSRYLIFVTPSIFFTIAWTLENLPKKIYTYTIGAFFAIMTIFMVYQNVSNNTPVKEDFEGVTNYLEENAKPQDIIVTTPPFTIYPLEYVYQGITKIETIPQWDRYKSGSIPQYNEADLVKQLDSYKLKYIRMYVIYSYDQGYEKNIRNYLDNHFQILENIKFGNDIKIIVYRLRYDISI